jgi:hypothetical protein
MAKKPATKAESIDLKRLRLRDGDVLVIREPRDAELGYRTGIIKKLGRTLKAKNVLIICAQSLSDIKALSPEQLANAGLQRIPDDS